MTWILAILPGALILLLVLWNHTRKLAARPFGIRVNGVTVRNVTEASLRLYRPLVDDGDTYPLHMEVKAKVRFLGPSTHHLDLLDLAELAVDEREVPAWVTVDGITYACDNARFVEVVIEPGAGGIRGSFTLHGAHVGIAAPEAHEDEEEAPPSSSDRRGFLATGPIPEDEPPPVTFSTGSEPPKTTS